MVTLDKVKRGQSVTINLIQNESVRSQAIRFGIATGESVTCEEVIPAGPIVIRKNRQLIALGRHLAKEINVNLN